jgi:hypothetical protein
MQAQRAFYHDSEGVCRCDRKPQPRDARGLMRSSLAVDAADRVARLSVRNLSLRKSMTWPCFTTARRGALHDARRPNPFDSEEKGKWVLARDA